VLSLVIAVLVVLAVLSFVLPYLGSHPGRLEPVP
jgi:cobalamin biosynthesis protein CbiG